MTVVVILVNDMYIDDMLQDQEQRRLSNASVDGRTRCCFQPVDILWIFDSQLGAPDDVIANLNHLRGYLDNYLDNNTNKLQKVCILFVLCWAG